MVAIVLERQLDRPADPRFVRRARMGGFAAIGIGVGLVVLMVAAVLTR
jgi:hypothetical protein